jgi:hypothetical protein
MTTMSNRRVFDPRPSWSWATYKCLKCLITAIGFGGYGVMGRLHGPLAGRATFAVAQVVIVVLSYAGAIAYILENHTLHAIEVLLFTLPSFFLAAAFIWERNLILYFYIAGLLDILGSLLSDIMFDPPEFSFAMWRIPFFGCAAVVTVTSSLIMRWSALMQSRKMIKRDEVCACMYV